MGLKSELFEAAIDSKTDPNQNSVHETTALWIGAGVIVVFVIIAWMIFRKIKKSIRNTIDKFSKPNDDKTA